jgi:hypothetical protein
MAGATGFSLSREQFADLKRTGSIQHHYVQLDPTANAVEWEATSVLRAKAFEMASVAVNDGLIKSQ